MFRFSFHFSFGLQKKEENIIQKEETSADRRRFIDVATEAVERLALTRERSTIANYRTALASLMRFSGEDLSVVDFNNQTIMRWQQRLKEQGVRMNTISCYMRSLRSLVAQADGLKHFKNAFDSAYTGHAATVKRSMPAEDIQKLYSLALPPESSLAFVRDIFLFSFYALGMPLVDMAFLKKSQMADGYIRYERHKTRREICVRVEPPMQAIIDRWGNYEGLYVFPLLTEGTMKEFEIVRNRYNRHLGRLSQMAGLSRRLTSYVARHSWASMAYSSNVDLPVISKALGHSNAKTTMTYIRDIENWRIDEANRRILDALVPEAAGNG